MSKKKQQKTIDVEIMMSMNDMKTISSDMVTLDSANGYVVMNFLQTFPVGREGDVEHRKGVPAARIMLSWEHFVQVFSKMSEQIKNMQESAEAKHRSAIDVANGITIIKASDDSE